MSNSYRIEDPKGRFITIPADASKDTIVQKIRDFLIHCDIRDNTKPSFGGGEYSDAAIAEAKAARENSSVHLSFENGKYNVSWQ